ncbi:hypothetical protein PSPO01_01827 [Paraphaeosphaeria sporulosa]
MQASAGSEYLMKCVGRGGGVPVEADYDDDNSSSLRAAAGELNASPPRRRPRAGSSWRRPASPAALRPSAMLEQNYQPLLARRAAICGRRRVALDQYTNGLQQMERAPTAAEWTTPCQRLQSIARTPFGTFPSGLAPAVG